MRYLLDECLCSQAAAAMTALAGDSQFTYLLDLAAPSTDDLDIPRICALHDFNVLITANVKDFGARKVIYEAVMKSGVHVLVLRPGKLALDQYLQVGFLGRHYPRYNKLMSRATTPTLATVNEGGVREITLAEILEEIAGWERRDRPS